MNKYIVEIGIEELPHLHIKRIHSQLTDPYIKQIADKYNLSFSSVKLYSTPRRIILSFDSFTQTSKILEIKGPLKDIAYENDDTPNSIAINFVKKNNSEISDIVFKEINKKHFLFLEKNVENNFTNDINNFINKIIKDINFTKPMRWNKSNITFSRPIRWIVSLLDNKIIPISIGTIKAGNISKPARFLGDFDIQIDSADTFNEQLLNEGNIIIDRELRKQNIYKQVSDIINEEEISVRQKYKLIIDEINDLVEYPKILVCEFDKKFLQLPKEIIETVIIKHQKYLPIYKDGKKEITNKFMVVSNHNLEKNNSKTNIKKGNEKVVNARLADGLFFYEIDKKKYPEGYYKKLDTITFQEQLGSMLDKQKRIVSLSSKIANKINLSKTNKNILQQTTEICKIDLATELVGEFASLQGTAGKLLYKEIYKNTQSEQIAYSLEAYYLPEASNNIIASIVSIADKIDTLVGFFGINLAPKGNSDPYALRRTAITLLKVLKKQINIPLKDLINLSVKNYSREISDNFDSEKLIKFVFTRYEKLSLLSYKKDFDAKIIKSIVYNSEDIIKNKELIFELVKNTNKDYISNLMELLKRLYNFTKDNRLKNEIDYSKLSEEEKEIYNNVKDINFKDYIANSLNNFIDQDKIITLINHYIDNTKIMDDNEGIRNKRLALLNYCISKFEYIFNISELLA